ncbi:MAG TPA: FAD-dependent oxidoreductase [Pyrinomonadaceae bacterium]|nr:FAD-dependent oxidoreductase [Pyrinomonadaceae bacterium]
MLWETEDAPYWFADVEKGLLSPVETFSEKVDAIIVGGGIMGISVAYWLSRAGIETLVLEAESLGNGASGRNAGLFLPALSPLENPEITRQVLTEENIHADFKITGHLALASNEEIWEKICDEALRRKNSLIPVASITRQECEDLLKLKINKAFRGGRWYPGGGLIHPLKFIYGLAFAAVKHGAGIRTGTKVLGGAVAGGNSSQTIETNRGKVRAKYVVWCCQARITNFVPGFNNFIKPVVGNMFSSAPVEKFFKFGLAIDWGTVYWRQTDDGSIICGGDENLQLAGQKTGKGLEFVLNEVFPTLPPIKVSRRWSGMMDYMIDGKPIVGSLPNQPNQWIIAGFGGHGIPAALGVGKALTESISREMLDENLLNFSPSRFAETV